MSCISPSNNLDRLTRLVFKLSSDFFKSSKRFFKSPLISCPFFFGVQRTFSSGRGARPALGIFHCPMVWAAHTPRHGSETTGKASSAATNLDTGLSSFSWVSPLSRQFLALIARTREENPWAPGNRREHGEGRSAPLPNALHLGKKLGFVAAEACRLKAAVQFPWCISPVSFAFGSGRGGHGNVGRRDGTG